MLVLAEARKTAKYTNLGQYHVFAPIAFETLGTWGIDANRIVTALGKKIAERSGEPRSLEFLRQRISVELQRGNATSVLGTMKDYNCYKKIFFRH